MPPVMGSVAFIAAEFMQTSYAQVALGAVIPAILYYGALFAIVDLRARRLGIGNTVPGEELPNISETLKKSWIVVVPLCVLLYFLIFLRKSPLLSSFWATAAIVVILFIKEKPSQAVSIFFKCLISGGKGAVSSAVGCALAGIIVGVLTRTGVAMKLSAFMIGLAGESVFLVLCLAAVISLILGMGVTATIAYIIPAMMVVPILVKAGIPPMAANIFVMYFSIISYITPPVALASYAAATVADSNFWQTGLAAFKLGLSGFIIPFMVVYGPSLVLIGTPLEIVWSCCTAVMGIILLAFALEGWMNGSVPGWGRILFFIAALCLVETGTVTDAIGFILGGSVVAFQLRRHKKQGGNGNENAVKS
jgi:TRAP transporter 4TM/12TM fusion protein